MNNSIAPEAQSAVRLNLAKGSAAYKNLTAPQLTAWVAYTSTQIRHNLVGDNNLSGRRPRLLNECGV